MAKAKRDPRPKRIRLREEQFQRMPKAVKQKGMAYAFKVPPQPLKPFDLWYVGGKQSHVKIAWKAGAGMFDRVVNAQEVMANARLSLRDLAPGAVWVHDGCLMLHDGRQAVEVHTGIVPTRRVNPCPFERCDFFENFSKELRIFYKLYVDTANNRSMSGFPQFLQREQGLKYVGSGHFSVVFKCPWDANKVIKLGLGSNHFGNPRDDGWLTYAKFCIEHRKENNPLLMKIHNLKMFDRYYIALLDRYTVTVYNYPQRGDKNDLVARRIASIATVFNRSFGGMFSVEREVPGQGTDDQWELYAWRFKEMIRKADLKVTDLHGHNVMVWNEGIVVTDPFDFSKMTIQEDLQQLGVEAA